TGRLGIGGLLHRRPQHPRCGDQCRGRDFHLRQHGRAAVDVACNAHVDGGFYGYPYDFIPRRPYTLWCMADYGGGAATGAFCYNEDALPPEYQGNLFLADFGKRQLLRLRIEREGATYKVVSREDFFADPPADFRPVGIALSPDGMGVYICDWNHRDTKENVTVGRLL